MLINSSLLEYKLSLAFSYLWGLICIIFYKNRMKHCSNGVNTYHLQ